MVSMEKKMGLEPLHRIGYGMYIIGSKKGEKLNAQIANTVFQVTSEPPTVAISINKKNLTHEYIKDSGVFSVSILCQATPLTFIGRFGFKSGRDINKLEGVNYKLGETKAPIVLDNAVACLEAKVVNQLDVGTHIIFIGEVIGTETVNAEEVCMTYDYYHQIKKGLTPRAAPTYVEKEKPAVKQAI